MQVSMQMHKDEVGNTMGQFTKFYYGFSFVTIFFGWFGFVITKHCDFNYY